MTVIHGRRPGWESPLPGILLASLLLGACTLGPEPRRPMTVADEAARFVNAPAAVGQSPLGRWWVSLADPLTDQLVAEALAGNTDLRVAGARVVEARALVGVARGQRWPAVGAFAAAARAKTNIEGANDNRIDTYDTSYDLGGTVAWQLDLFGKLRRGQQAASAELLASEADREALVHTVVAETVRLRAQVATLQQQLDLARADIENWQRTYQIIQRRYSRGVANALELRLARENLAATLAAEPEIEFALRASMHALDVLLGRQPGTGDLPERTLSPIPDLAPPPVGVPAALLDRRPDLRADELRTAAATYDIGIALADLYPDVTLSASGGYRAGRLLELFDLQGIVYRIAGEAASTIFAGGALRANVDAARARAAAAAALYAGRVLRAMQEVEDALVRELTARQRYAQLLTRLTEARAAERLATGRYQRGLSSLITVLETERRRRIAETQMIITQQTIWDARIDLILALGGDWRTDEPNAPDDPRRTTSSAAVRVAEE